VDGGLFFMCLLLSCVEHKLQCCPLTLGVTNAKAAKIAEAGNISNRERLIMMMAFGHGDRERLKAAASPRLALDAVLKFHE
jgi:nitroreductase